MHLLGHSCRLLQTFSASPCMSQPNENLVIVLRKKIEWVTELNWRSPENRSAHGAETRRAPAASRAPNSANNIGSEQASVTSHLDVRDSSTDCPAGKQGCGVTDHSFDGKNERTRRSLQTGQRARRVIPLYASTVSLTTRLNPTAARGVVESGQSRGGWLPQLTGG